MTRKKLALSIILLLVFIIYMSVPASAEYSDNIFTVEDFEVVSYNTSTKEITKRVFDTSVTTSAKKKGAIQLSTPAYPGVDPCVRLVNTNDEPTRIVMGNDDRKRVTSPQSVFPYRAICRIVTYWDLNNDNVIDDTMGVCTGFLEGPNAVVTAGHAIYNTDYNKWCEYAEVLPAQNGPNSAPYGIIESTTIHTSEAWTENGDWNQDWAVIELESNVGYSTGWLGKAWSANTLNSTGITVAGYPGDIATSINDKYNDVQCKGQYMWYCTGTIIISYPARVEYTADSAAGMSGSPVYNSDDQALAIDTYSSNGINGGTRITEWLYNFLVQFQE